MAAVRRNAYEVLPFCAGLANGCPRLLAHGEESTASPAPWAGSAWTSSWWTSTDVHEDDEAILWGGACRDSAEDIARKTDTISYEVLCGVAHLSTGRDHGRRSWILNN